MANLDRIAEVCEAFSPELSGLLGSLGGTLNPVDFSNGALGGLVSNVTKGLGEVAMLPSAASITGGIVEAKVGRTGLEPYAIMPERLGQFSSLGFGVPKSSAMGLAA